ncbi:putative selenate ABC transporter substrate-binding protein [Leptolyngbya ohadii]|uniref:putative selenate ABC transporter substrate-binding protein n=1 Tax=Leptolyngbya ohadii TaxID=1962290 RepID=UPI000B59B6B2|nr:putative selenate ABC transporter substrate-binding protein [Leptolyngbya ohadii]
MKRLFVPALLALLLPIASCAPNSNPAATSGNPSGDAAAVKPLAMGAIPDQNPEELQRLYGKLSAYLTQELGVPVEYKPVTDYNAAVTAFRVGDLDLVWYGALTGVQARLQVPGAEAIAQRDIDANFHSVFIANKQSGLKPFQDIGGLQSLKGRTFSFGSESSTSGRLMPQHFLSEAGVKLEDFKGQPAFSSNHDTIIKAVEAGTFEAGVLNEQVWQERVDEGKVDLSKIEVIWRTPPYFNYHWVINPQVKERYGADFTDKVKAALLKLDPNVPEQKEILDLFGAQKFIATENSNYQQIEQVGREIGKIQ